MIADALGTTAIMRVVKICMKTCMRWSRVRKTIRNPLPCQARCTLCSRKSGVPDEKIQFFEKEFEEVVKPDTPILVSISRRHANFSIETPDVVIKVNPERMDLVETRVIDGRACLVIPVDDYLEVTGMPVSVEGSSSEGAAAALSDLIVS